MEPSQIPRPLVAFGDSYTEGTGAAERDAYPAVLSRALGRPVINAGVAGETAREALPRLAGDVLRHHPRLVLVEFGANEAFRGYPVSRALDGLEQILAALAEREIPAILVGVRLEAYQANFDAGLQSLAEKHRAGLVLDALAGILGDARLRSDPYHPNAAGYAILAQRILPAVQRTLEA